MKKLIALAIVFTFTLALTAWSAPFLVCDCQDNVEQYVLIFDGGTPITVDAVATDCTGSQKRLSMDMAPLNLPDGQHHLEGAAKNVWETTTYVPFDFNKAGPSGLSGIGLSVTP